MTNRSPRLQDKVAIVTGAGSRGPGIGIGKAISILFAREGAKVLLVDSMAERAQETLQLIQAEEGEASVFQADVTSLEDCRDLAETAIERYGRLDILCNNVGDAITGNVVDVDESAWDQIMTLNVKSIVLTSRFAIPRMVGTGGGSIINLSSIAGMGAMGSTPYSTSKGAVISLTKSMALDHGRDNIRVNTIAPGYIYTPMVAAGMTEEHRERRKDIAPLGVEGDAWDIAWAAVYLASDESRWVSGIVLPVDAGLTATVPSPRLELEANTPEY